MSSSSTPGDNKTDLEAEVTESVEDAEVVEAAADAEEAAPPNEDVDALIESPHDEGEHHDEDASHGSGFAATALKFLIIVIVIFGIALWLVPRIAHELPASVAKHLMPGQQVLDDKLAQVDQLVTERTQAADAAVGEMKTQMAELTARLEAAESAATAAREQAEAARSAAQQSADAATGTVVAEEVVVKAENAAREAAQTAATATTAATEAGKVASAATRDTASLARRMTAFEARLNALTDELAAINQSFASTGSAEGGPASPELAAAVAALQAKVESLGIQVEKTEGLITTEDAARFATQDDLRSARTALSAEMKEALGAFPAPATVATVADLDAARTGLTARVDGLADRVAKAESAATEAQGASTTALGQVEGAIRDASLRSAVAALTSRMQNGVAYANALDEIERLTGSTPPAALTQPAKTGVVTPEWLLRGWGRKAQAALAAEIKANADDGVFGQASARLRSVVSGRPKNEQEGDDAAAIISRIEARLKDGLLADALAEAETLPEVSREALGDWLDRLRARVAADKAAIDYVASLGAS